MFGLYCELQVDPSYGAVIVTAAAVTHPRCGHQVTALAAEPCAAAARVVGSVDVRCDHDDALVLP
jgi:hypothetical protein